MTRMPFGRHRGRALADLPAAYLAWLVRLGDLREPLRSAVAQEAERRLEQEQEHGEPTAVPAGVRDAGDAIVSVGYRAVAARCHPDHGGDTATMQHVNAAAEWLRRQLRSLSA